MSRGGARARSGPAPTSTERSHKAKADAQGWTTLPAEGRDRERGLPAFPLLAPTDREMDLWERLWETPQAVMWETLHLDFEVASYVRLLVRAESPRSSAIVWGQVKQFAESLGLSASGMLRNRWTVASVNDDQDQSPAQSAVSSVSSLTARLKAVQGE